MSWKLFWNSFNVDISEVQHVPVIPINNPPIVIPNVPTSDLVICFPLDTTT